jgi:hypothetical protein
MTRADSTLPTRARIAYLSKHSIVPVVRYIRHLPKWQRDAYFLHILKLTVMASIDSMAPNFREVHNPEMS